MPSKNGTEIGLLRVIEFRQDENIQRRKVQYARSAVSVRDAKLAVRELIECLWRRGAEISADDHSPTLHLGEAQGICFVQGIAPGSMTIRWHDGYSKSLEGAKLKVDIYDGSPSVPGYMISREGKRIHASTFTFGLSSQVRAVFFEGNAQYHPQELAEKLIRWYMDEASKLSERQRR